MDSVGGAKILTERFSDEGGTEPLPSIVAVDALPLFHWAGVEPEAPTAQPAPAEPADPRGSRRRRFRARKR